MVQQLLGLALQVVRDSTALEDKLLRQVEVNRKGYTWLRTINSKSWSKLCIWRIIKTEKESSWEWGLYEIYSLETDLCSHKETTNADEAVF